jgi:hypothetical protein
VLKKQRNEGRQRVPQRLATASNQYWSLDFVSDRLADGRWFCALTLVDQRRALMSIAVDNGSVFASWAMDAWAYGFFSRMMSSM